jgi:hypothetical protein
MPDDESFSKRYGFAGPPKEITIREAAPPNLRTFVLRTVKRDLGFTWSLLRQVLCDVLLETPNKYNWTEDPNIREEVEEILENCEWFKVYDFIEALHSHVAECDADGNKNFNNYALRFADEINSFFIEKGIGWQLVNGKITTRGDGSFERTIQLADHELTDRRQTTRTRIQEAINGLSRRPEPDLPGAISHAFAAMECIIGDIEYTPEEARENKHHTFGSFLYNHPDLFPSNDLKDGFQKLWTYANNEGSRHGKEGIEPARDEAELIVSVAAALVTYLNRKHPK